MAKVRRDTQTIDWLDPSQWSPPEVEERFEPAKVRASTLPAKVSRVLSEALRGAGKSREDVAGELSDFLDEDVTTAMLDTYASEAREKNNIPAYRLMALVALLDRPEILNELLSDTRFMVIDRKFKPLIERELAIEMRENLDRFIGKSDSDWKVRR